MANLTNASNRDVLIKSSYLEQRTMVLSALARIIAKAYLGKTAADKNAMEMTIRNSQNYSINDINNRDVSRL